MRSKYKVTPETNTYFITTSLHLRKGGVEKPEDWKYSSARNYLLGDDSLIVLDKIT
ncbi:MAG: hypothetical protein JXM69_13340 [Anaerolineae bacterium]|nr:hypothetical protein [Anaerolineae bacterium]